jgi:hypothetical protein
MVKYVLVMFYVVVVVFVNGVVDVVYSFRRFVDEGLEVVKGVREVLGFPVLFGVSRYINARSVDSILVFLRGLGALICWMLSCLAGLMILMRLTYQLFTYKESSC